MAAAMQRPRAITPWVRRRLDNQIPRIPQLPLRWESYLYGPLNVLCSEILPAGQRFMVAPQLIIIDEYEGEFDSMEVNDQSLGDVDLGVDEPDNVSVDNMGGWVPGRKLGRIEEGSSTIPDFTLLKVPASGATDNDLVFGLIEVKRGWQAEELAENTMKRYVKLINVKENRSPHFKAFLVLGERTQIWVPDADPEIIVVQAREVDTVGGLETELRALAQLVWN